tara:strand:- start:63812 stop:64300 length:489 start_codon:yes stop_codon:yes gene_type:complete
MMKIPKTKAAWKKLQATSLKEAFRLDKEYAREIKRLTVPAIAELMGASEDSLYKWLSNASMPTNLVPSYEHICGIDFITQYLAIRSHKLLIDIPTGRQAAEIGLAEFQQLSADTTSLLVKHYQNGGEIDQTVEALTKLMAGAAFHRANIKTQPELEFDGDVE